ncbi:PIR Superfamily Protein [Plasmodium ovale wallikeri]|uniref:PIR Superfamily Protein n=1 Tax=Plasmodium ovale wallikeri TaxID=864142 RepID=A0A1A9AR01_PLAOA|nr:PIR Superfamily Protein [Plasmodium ovale wallikeri]
MASYLEKKDLELLLSTKYFKELDTFPDVCYEDIAELKKQLGQCIESDVVTNKIVNALCDTSFKDKENENCIERCEYLFFWIGDILFDKFKDAQLFPKITSVIYALLNKFGNRHKCTCTDKFSYANINIDNFKEMKLAYSYYKDYEHFRIWIPFYKHSCDKYYNKHVQDAFNAYNKTYDTCHKSYEGYCRTIRDVIPKLFYNKYDEHKCTVIDGETEDTLDESSLRLEQFSQSPQEVNASTPAILMSILLPLLGIVFFALYKFTPLGLLLHSYLLKKRIIQSSIHEEESLDFLSNEYEYTDRDSFMKKGQIGYHPTTNNS